MTDEKTHYYILDTKKRLLNKQKKYFKLSGVRVIILLILLILIIIMKMMVLCIIALSLIYFCIYPHCALGHTNHK